MKSNKVYPNENLLSFCPIQQALGEIFGRRKTLKVYTNGENLDKFEMDENDRDFEENGCSFFSCI